MLPAGLAAWQNSTIAGLLLVDEFFRLPTFVFCVSGSHVFRAHQGGVDFDEAWQSWEAGEFFVASRALEARAVDMRRFLAAHLGRALRPFHLLVSTRSEDTRLRNAALS